LSLVNTVTGVGRPFSNGAVIDYKTGTLWYILARDPRGGVNRGVQPDNGAYVSTDTTEPFDSDPGTPAVGQHQIVASPFRGTAAGTPIKVTFTIVDTRPTPTPTPTPPTPTPTPTPYSDADADTDTDTADTDADAYTDTHATPTPVPTPVETPSPPAIDAMLVGGVEVSGTPEWRSARPTR
jgi:hypothetical protein